MATLNPFDLLDGDTEDPSLFVVAKQVLPASVPNKKGAAQVTQQAKPTAKLPSKPLPPSQAVREARNDGQRGGGRGGPRGGFRGRGRGRGFNQDFADGENTFGSSNGLSGGYKAPEDGESGRPSERRVGYGGPRGAFRGGRRGGFSNGDAADGERPRRAFERRSGTGHGYEFKREGAGRGNWGSPTDELAPETEVPVNEGEKIVDADKQDGQADAADASKDTPAVEPEEKEPEEKEMTLEEYEKVLEEKRKALLALKPEERKVNLDKEFESMQLLSNKKSDDEVFVKLGSEKEKHKEAVEKAKKTKSINEFLKPADGESYYRPGGRGRGRGRGRGGSVGNNSVDAPFIKAPSIEDVGQFPSLGAK
ncbi:RGG repeats nuclear RNA binding protein A-like [Lycium ferocissimum]|uniref:RGG repeats nuclear RNA binding protein A-like n=1 Tax=Lycium ferocissimum TaxID=112874 RepID=UPI002815964E|nr:RGG repeats nuclear RNA binding protein A-like [Lycium ferocissimum]